jgi:hypothetical protein
MRGLVPRIHAFAVAAKDVDGRDSACGRPGHDEQADRQVFLSTGIN